MEVIKGSGTRQNMINEIKTLRLPLAQYVQTKKAAVNTEATNDWATPMNPGLCWIHWRAMI